MTAQAQIIERDGQPEYAVVPIETYRRLVELAEDMEDIRAYDRAMAEIERGVGQCRGPGTDRQAKGKV